MSKNVIVNDVEYPGVSQIQLNTASGGTAYFKDVDEINTEGLETQTVACQTALSTYGGVEFECITEGHAVYIGVPDVVVSSTNRVPHIIVANIDHDNGYYNGLFCGYTGASPTCSPTVMDGVCTINGASAVWLKDGTNFTFKKVSM